MIVLFPNSRYKVHLPYERERTVQAFFYDDGSEYLNGTELFFSNKIKKMILQNLNSEGSYLDQNHFFLCINSILDLITQNYPLSISFFTEIWDRNLGVLLIDFIENSNSIKHLTVTLNLIFFLLKVKDAQIFFSEYKLKNILIRIISSFPSEPELINYSFMILSILLPFCKENMTIYFPNLFFKLSTFYNFENCEQALCTFIHSFVRNSDISQFYEPMSKIFNSILFRHNFSTQTLILILKTICRIQTRSQIIKNGYLNTVIDNIIVTVSDQIENSSSSVIYEFLKFTKNSILFSEKSRIYRLLRSTSICSLIRIFQSQEEAKIKTLILEILSEILKIEREVNYFCQFDLIHNFDENLIYSIIHNFNKKSFFEKQAVLRLLIELTEFQKIETFEVLKVKSNFIFDTLTHFAFNSEDDLTIYYFLTFLINIFEMSLLFEDFTSFSFIGQKNLHLQCSFISNYYYFDIDQFVDLLISQTDDRNILNQAQKLQSLVNEASQNF